MEPCDRIAYDQNNDQDRMSELPEDLKIQILSSLEMKDAVNTGTLSKSWKNLWTQIDSIVFKYPKANDQIELQQITSFIHHTLMQCVCPIIKRFTLSFGNSTEDDKYMHDLVENWMKFVLNKNIQFFMLDNSGKRFSVPNCLYKSSSLLKLELHNVDIPNLSGVSWSSLKHFSLKNPVSVEEGCIENILLGCPVLEDLVLEDIDVIENLNIMVPNVKRLVLRYIGNVTIDEVPLKLSIRAPKLEEIEVSGWLVVSQFLMLEAFCSLRKATLNFVTDIEYTNQGDDLIHYVHSNATYGTKWIDIIIGILNDVRNVGELVIGSQLLLVCSLIQLLCIPFPFVSYPIFKCRHVTVNSQLWMYDLPGIAFVLENSPYLETLIVEVSQWKIYEDIPDLLKPKFTNEDQPHLSMKNGKFSYLKNVKIDYMRSSCYEDDTDSFDFELVGYIMRSAVALKKLVICSSKPHCESCGLNCKYKNVPILSSELVAKFQLGNEGRVLARCR